MIEKLIFIILATLTISLISLVGLFTLSRRVNLSGKLLNLIVSFAAGAILAVVFFDLLPEAFEMLHSLLWVLVGIALFFIFESGLHWHHHHENCSQHDKKDPIVFLNLLGDALHNFLDGVLIAASFLTGNAVGVATTFAIALHEIPQEIGDFAILVKGGLSKGRALFFNFISAIFAVLGGIIGFLFLSSLEGLIPYVISLAAGGLLYIATADIIPDLQRERNYKKMLMQIIAFILGALIVGSLISSFGEHTHNEEDLHDEEMGEDHDLEINLEENIEANNLLGASEEVSVENISLE